MSAMFTVFKSILSNKDKGMKGIFKFIAPYALSAIAMQPDASHHFVWVMHTTGRLFLVSPPCTGNNFTHYGETIFHWKKSFKKHRL